jgi:hypothetical protein
MEKHKVQLSHPSNTSATVFKVLNVFSKIECEQLKVKCDVRLADVTRERLYKAMVHEPDEETANFIYDRVKDHLVQEYHGYYLLGTSPKVRFMKYDIGHIDRPHFDMIVLEQNGDRSFFTLLVYLNTEDYEGGGTRFLDSTQYVNRKINTDGETTDVKTGDVLVFQHDVYHMGEKLSSGTKYLIRIDIVYSKQRKK